MSKKSQGSLEFLIILGIGFLIIAILGSIFFNFFIGEKKTLDSKHIDNIGLEIMSNIDRVYFMGIGNRVTVETIFPEGIENISIHHFTDYDYLNITFIGNKIVQHKIYEPSEIYIRFNCSECKHNYTTNISYFNDSSLFSKGNKRIRIDGKKDFVEISFTR